MSMTWMRMPGQTWAAAAESFLAMWVVMMTAMMLPSLVPMLRRYRHAVRGTSRSRLDGLTALAGLGYFYVWTLFGLVIFPLGVVLATAEMKVPALGRSVPMDAGAIIALAGALQFTRRKAYHLGCCRDTPGISSALPAEAGAAWHQGVDLGVHCSLSCANLIAILLVIGLMDLRMMAAVTAAITGERLAPVRWQALRVIGLAAIGTGLTLIIRATGAR